MRLYLFRHTDKIPMDTMKIMAEKTINVLGIDAVVFEEPVKIEVKEMDICKLLKITDAFLERDEDVVAAVFTNERLVDEEILGEKTERSKGFWVSVSNDESKTFAAFMHQLGHIFEACHCTDRECFMYPYYSKNPAEDTELDNVMCSSCLHVIKESWIYTRLISSSLSRRKKGKSLPKLVSSSPSVKTTENTTPHIEPGISEELPPMNNESNRTFPDWSLPKEIFISEVKEFFGYKD